MHLRQVDYHTTPCMSNVQLFCDATSISHLICVHIIAASGLPHDAMYKQRTTMPRCDQYQSFDTCTYNCGKWTTTRRHVQATHDYATMPTRQSKVEIWRTIRLQSHRIPTITPFSPNGRKRCNQTQETLSSSCLAADCESTLAFVQTPTHAPNHQCPPSKLPQQRYPSKLPKQRYPSKSHIKVTQRFGSFEMSPDIHETRCDVSVDPVLSPPIHSMLLQCTKQYRT